MTQPTPMTQPDRAAMVVTTIVPILAFIADRPGMFGRHRTARIMVGNVTEEDLDRAADLPVGGALPGQSQAAVVRAIDALLGAGCLAKTYGDRPRLTLTRAGWNYLTALETITTMEAPQQ